MKPLLQISLQELRRELKTIVQEHQEEERTSLRLAGRKPKYDDPITWMGDVYDFESLMKSQEIGLYLTGLGVSISFVNSVGTGFDDAIFVKSSQLSE